MSGVAPVTVVRVQTLQMPGGFAWLLVDHFGFVQKLYVGHIWWGRAGTRGCCGQGTLPNHKQDLSAFFGRTGMSGCCRRAWHAGIDLHSIP